MPPSRPRRPFLVGAESGPAIAAPVTDDSHGYESVAAEFIRIRERSTIGVALLGDWLATLPPRQRILEVGCGCGIPVTRTLVAAGHTVEAIDASTSLVRRFRENLPEVPVRCVSWEDAAFDDGAYDAAVAIGVVFLLDGDAQPRFIRAVANALAPGGRFLFTAPTETGTWEDVNTGRVSRSLGEAAYARALGDAGLRLLGARSDEGRNNHYDAAKPGD